MRKSAMLGWAVLAVVVVSASWQYQRSNVASASIAPREAPVVAQIRSQLAERRVLVEALQSFGEVTPGQVVGVSFPRAGQVTRLSVLAGQRVSRGALLAVLAPDPNATLAYDQAINGRSIAEREVERQQELLKLRLGTQSQVDAASKAYLDAVSSVNALRAVGGGSGSSEIHSPFDGVILSLAVAQGDRVAAGAAILQLGHADALRVQLGIEPVDIHRVRVGTSVSLQPVVSGKRSATTVESQVSEIQDIVDAKTQLVNATVLLPGRTSRDLVPGMKVRASVEIGKVDATAVPVSAVLTDEHGSYLFQVVDAKARRIAVVRGIESGGWVGVTGLANPAIPVVASGNYELQDGMAVREEAP